MTERDDVLDSDFHGGALRAYLKVWARTKQFPPDSETTRIRAYQLYEEALAEKNRRKPPTDASRSLPREAGPGCAAPQGSGEPHLCVAGKSDLRPKTTVNNCLADARKVAK